MVIKVNQNNIENIKMQMKIVFAKLQIANEVISVMSPKPTGFEIILYKIYNSKSKNEIFKYYSSLLKKIEHMQMVKNKKPTKFHKLSDDEINRIIISDKYKSKISELSSREKAVFNFDLSLDPFNTLKNALSDYISLFNQLEKEQQSQLTTNKDPKPINQEKKENDRKKEFTINEILYGQGQDYITEEQLNHIFKQYPGIRVYYKKNEFNAAIKINQIQSKISSNELISLSDMIDLAILVKNSLPNALYYKLDIGSLNNEYQALAQNMNLENSLEVYKKAYTTFMAKYRHMNTRQKEKLFQTLKTHDYKETFGVELTGDNLITPEELRNDVNIQITSKFKNERMFTMFWRPEQSQVAVAKIVYATRYMSLKEIAELYFSLKEKLKQEYNKYGHYNADEAEYQKVINEDYPKYFQTLQSNFLTVLYTKSQSLDNKANTVEELCEKYLNETPLTTEMRALESNQERNNSKQAIQTTEEKIKSEASQRYYNLGKLKQANARINGSWQRFVELMENEKELSSEELEELNGLFRG